jgi:hypothetical protein
MCPHGLLRNLTQGIYLSFTFLPLQWCGAQRLQIVRVQIGNMKTLESVDYMAVPTVGLYDALKASLICCGCNYVLHEIVTAHLLVVLYIGYLNIKNVTLPSVIHLQ